MNVVINEPDNYIKKRLRSKAVWRAIYEKMKQLIIKQFGLLSLCYKRSFITRVMELEKKT
jgi:hypothetical protein